MLPAEDAEPSIGPDARRPWTPLRVVLALVLGCVSTAISYVFLRARDVGAGDFTWPWRAARALLAGQDPYRVIRPVGPYPFDDWLLYPLPAAILSLPFAPFRAELAGALFVGVSAAFLCYAVTRDGYQRLPLFLGGPFLKVLMAPQWAPLIVAAALTPWLQWITVAKPNIGLAALSYRPSWRGLILCAAFLLASVAVLPAWPGEWRAIVGADPRHPPPVGMFLGPLLLIAWAGVRRRDARLLAAMSVIPQELLLYDQLALWLLPRRWWSSLLLSVLSWPALVAWVWPPAYGFPKMQSREVTEFFVMTCIYMPALYMVVRRMLKQVGRRAATGAQVAMT